MDPSQTAAHSQRAGTSDPAHVSEFAGYRLIATLGKGAIAKVYLALKQGPAGFTKLVVVKALRREHIHSLEHIEMFLDEARLAALLNHPNLAQSYEVGEEDGRYFIEMEYLAGQTLRSVQRRVARDAFPVALRLKILSEVARGLHYAHELSNFDQTFLQLVHRDVTPHNILLTYDGHVKLLDFGIAKSESNEHFTEVGTLKGKADYLAPEQIRGGDIDRRADIFALGVMAYEAVTGRSFSGGEQVPLVTRLHTRVTGTEPRVREVNPNVPPYLAALIDRATALRPSERIATAAEFADRMDDFLERTQAHVSPSVLANLLDEPFAADRAQLDRLVEVQARNVRGMTQRPSRHTAVLPNVDNALHSPSEVDLPAPSIVLRMLNEDSPAATPSQRPVSKHTRLAPSVPPGDAELEAAARAQRPMTLAKRAARKAWLQAAALTLTGAAVVLLGAHFLRLVPELGAEAPRPTSPASTPPRTEPLVASAPAAEPPQPSDALPEMVRIKIQVVPSDAHVFLDGAALETPADLAMEKSGRTHLLHLRAPGYEPVDTEFSQLENTELFFEMTEKRARRGRADSRPRSRKTVTIAHDVEAAESYAPTPAAHSPLVRPTPPKQLRPTEAQPKAGSGATIDTDNPYTY